MSVTRDVVRMLFAGFQGPLLEQFFRMLAERFSLDDLPRTQL